jgi:hypothetical protein
LEIKDGSVIDGVIPSKNKKFINLVSWNRSSEPDLLITTTKEGVTEAGIYAINNDFNYVLVGSKIELMSKTQPFVGDINGDF